MITETFVIFSTIYGQRTGIFANNTKVRDVMKSGFRNFDELIASQNYCLVFNGAFIPNDDERFYNTELKNLNLPVSSHLFRDKPVNCARAVLFQKR